MIIHDLNFVCVRIAPDETDPPLIVNANAVLARPVSLQRLEPIATRNGKIRKLPSKVYLLQFSQRDTFKSLEARY